MILCNLSSLLPLPFLKWIEEEEDAVAREAAAKQQKKSFLGFGRSKTAKTETAPQAPLVQQQIQAADEVAESLLQDETIP